MAVIVNPRTIKSKLKFVRNNNFDLTGMEEKDNNIYNHYASNQTGYKITFIFRRDTCEPIRMVNYD